MASRSVIILDSALEVSEGHHDHFVRHARRDLAAQGVELVVHGSRHVAASLAQELQVVPRFSRNLHDLVSPDPYDGPLVDTFVGANTFAQKAEPCLGGLSGSGDLVILPTATVAELAGLVHLAQRSAPTYRLAVLFHRTGRGPFKPAGPGSLTGALLRSLGRGLSIFDANGLWIGAVTEPLRASISAALDRPVHLAPSPVWYAAARQAPPASRRRVGFLGHLRIEKGCVGLDALVRTLAAAAPEATSVVGGHHDRDASDLSALMALADVGADLQLGWRDEEAFADLVASCDLIVLPYDPREYSDASSGIFSHAVAHGKPVVAPAGTWMADQIAQSRAAGLAYPPGGVTEIAGAIKRAISDLGTLSPLASARSVEWRRRECGGRLMEQLLDFGIRH